MNQLNKGDKEILVIAGGGPAGLTLAYELATTSASISPIVFEASETLGGISRTICHNGNYMDVGGHRFFTKIPRIMDLWKDIMPLQEYPSKDELSGNHYQQVISGKQTGNPEISDNVFLRRRRVSRIYFNKRFFDYPVTLRSDTLKAMGFKNTIDCVIGFIKAKLKHLPETSLENFYINRFGRPLYEMFFENYTEKVWGLHPSGISADWGAQRVKTLSLWSVINEMIIKKFRFPNNRRREIETSLIDTFHYPKFGPGQMWSQMAENAAAAGAEIQVGTKVKKIQVGKDNRIESVMIETAGGDYKVVECDYFASSMPLCELIDSLEGIEVPEDIRLIAEGLKYRDFITVGILLPKLNIKNNTSFPSFGDRIPDTWIYIQDPEIKLGRIQIFNNWSPYIVKDFENTIWIGLEYFCNEGDELWTMSPQDFIDMAIGELEHLGIASGKTVMDAIQIKERKAYPSYSGTYDKIHRLRDFLDGIPNLFCIGRNGQHRYNNMDHSMMTGLLTADYLSGKSMDKAALWKVNTESSYNEGD
ncbi:MAG: NAD(P)/FAD-dependent oxidoreductase [Muribaculaceae bacterium]|nr:NAD(P)/FAD-dependent oxidoreductase [Muribaculaceae bacterium]